MSFALYGFIGGRDFGVILSHGMVSRRSRLKLTAKFTVTVGLAGPAAWKQVSGWRNHLDVAVRMLAITAR